MLACKNNNENWHFIYWPIVCSDLFILFHGIVAKYIFIMFTKQIYSIYSIKCNCYALSNQITYILNYHHLIVLHKISFHSNFNDNCFFFLLIFVLITVNYSTQLLFHSTYLVVKLKRINRQTHSVIK